MRNAVVQLPGSRSANEQRQVLRAAVRQLERAELYLAAVAAMELDDRAANRALAQLRRDVDALRHHLIDVRAET
jgi:gamma-glutamyl phosphate reductase